MGLKYNKTNLQLALSLLKERLIDKPGLPLKDKGWLSKVDVLPDMEKLVESQLTSEFKKELELFLEALKELSDRFKLEDLFKGNISLFDMDEIGRGETVTKDFIDLQNMSFIIISEVFHENFIKSIDATSNAHDMWDVIFKLSDILHHLESLDKMEIFEMIGHHEEQFSQNGGASTLYRAFEEWAMLCPEEAKELLVRLIQVSSELPLTFLPRIISGLGKVKSNLEIFELVQDKITTLVHILDRYLLIGLSELDYTISSNDQKIIKFIERITLDSGIQDEPTSIRIWLNLISTSSKAKEELIRISALTDNPNSKHMFISAIWAQALYKTDFDFTKDILLNLKPVDPENLGTIGRISYLLEKLIEVNSYFAVNLFLKWLSNPAWQKRQGEEFHGFVRHISGSNAEALNGFMFYGLLNGPFPVQVQILNICTRSNFQKNYIPQFPVDKLRTCDDAKLELLMRRTIGFIYDKDVLRSLLLSILHLKTLSNNMKQFLKNLFLQYVCFNYTSTIEWFEQPFIQRSKILKEFCDEVSQAYEEYLDSIYNLSILKEFKPSHERMTLFNKLMASQTEKAQKESESKGFLSTVTSIKLKGANKWIIKTNGELSEISSLSKFEVSSEFPRGECIDPIAMERIRISNK